MSLYKSEINNDIIKSQTFYVCHYCIDYKTESLSDMYKHFKRKKKCKCSTLHLYEEAEDLTKNRKYTFNFDTINLSKFDYLFIITHYNDKNNIIHNNFKEEILNKNTNTLIESGLCDNFKNNEINKDSLTERTCKLCKQLFNNKSNLIRHLKYNQSSCEQTQIKNKLFQKMNEDSIKKIEKEKEVQSINNTYIGTQNNNIQNNNNPQNNTYNFTMQDFVNDRYDISHIKDEFYSKKDFFLYPIFLDAIMQNKNNHNIFITDNDAIIYTDNELNKMSSDKAGYMVLDKLSQSFEQIFYKNDKETQDYYSFIQKYYHVVKGHYKHDTIYKEYDVDECKFIYTANSRLFRSRDKYLTKITGTLGRYKNSARENMNISINEIKDIPILNPIIEDFCSIRNRYKDLHH